MSFETNARAARLLARRGLPHSHIVNTAPAPAANDACTVRAEAIDAAMFLNKVQDPYREREAHRALQAQVDRANLNGGL